MSGVYGKFGLAAFPDAFPKETRDDAAPLAHVGKAKPPFLITWGDGDPINLRVGGKELGKKLDEAGVKVKTLEVKDRNHISIVTKIGSEKDELTAAVVQFVKETAKPSEKSTEKADKAEKAEKTDEGGEKK